MSGCKKFTEAPIDHPLALGISLSLRDAAQKNTVDDGDRLL